MTMRDKLELLKRRAAEAEQGGGAERLKAQHAKGKLSARERLDLLLDEGSFVELDRFVTHRSDAFGLGSQRVYGDGVVTAFFGKPDVGQGVDVAVAQMVAAVVRSWALPRRCTMTPAPRKLIPVTTFAATRSLSKPGNA